MAIYMRTGSIRSAIAELNKHGTVVARSTVMRHLADDADFAYRLAEAKEDHTEILEEELFRRAVIGVEEPVFGTTYVSIDGHDKPQRVTGVVGRVRKYSDTLLIFRLKALRPDVYRERLSVLSEDQLDSAIREAEDELARRRSLRAAPSEAAKAPGAPQRTRKSR